MPATYLRAANFLPSPIPMGVPTDAVITPGWIKLPPVGPGANRPCVNNETLLKALGALVTGMTAPKLGLFTNAVSLGPATMYSDIVEPQGTWYTAGGVVITFGATYVDIYGQASVESILHQWQYSGVSPAETVRGWYISDTF